MSRRPLTTVLAAVTALGLVVVPAGAQEADRTSSRQVERQLGSAEDRLADLEAQASLAVEEVNAAKVELDRAERELAETVEAAAAAEARAEELRAATDAVARSLYKSGGANLQFSALLHADGPTEAGARYATVQHVLTSHRGDVEALHAVTTELSSLREQLGEQRDQAATRAAELTERRDRLRTTLAAQADEIATLERELAAARSAEEAAREAARAEAERAAAEEAAARTDDTTPAATTPAERPEPAPSADRTSAPATRSSAQKAVDTALAQVGSPYRWGGGGPDSFDCSGLTSFAWRAAGVSLPHSSRMQYGATQRISRSQLQPGDLVFFGSPIHHVAMYIGGGSVVEASRAGVPVRVSSTALGRSDVAGYGRP